ncbi:hypothetical protein FIBSPDRAFT_923037 [Athelia psychrophila]|uniref:NAD(P)-binding protein n=1 Tax=Athelia psychrophila TaxID=1759441 RepID=A0A167WPT3_9AGAM|nr:hypothetical protein FIBSPDRAFT_923037 [Fibularhizoctonia sp. CBS 109695]
MTQMHLDQTANSQHVDILILGAGWTSTFLIPLCESTKVSYAATSRSGRDGTLPFHFNPEEEDDPTAYEQLPHAQTVLITFPINTKGASGRLIRLYRTTHGGEGRFIQLGTTSIWGSKEDTKSQWFDRHSQFNATNPRAVAEAELLGLPDTTVINLSGLWGGERSMRGYVSRVAPSKEALRNKTSLHMIHGSDVARAILAVHANFALASGQRFILNDMRIYDWWDLASAWGANRVDGLGGVPEGPQPAWVRELMDEEGVRALPRDMSKLGRLMDGRDFWKIFDLNPARARLE